MELSPIISDGMVLQRGADNRIWGKTLPGEEIEGEFGGAVFETRAGADGTFEAVLPRLAVGGPYELKVRERQNPAGSEKVISDVLVGDVFLLGGQSNMELPVVRTEELLAEEIEKSKDSCIRMFEVPKEYFFAEGEKELSGGRWTKACGEELWNLSAAGFFMAHAIKEHTGIPIGLIQTAVGGTPAKAWCSRETILRMGRYTEELETCSEEGYPKKVEEADAEREGDWRKRAMDSFADKAIRSGSLVVPGIWKSGELADFRGAIRLTKTVELTKEEAGADAELVMGAIVDADEIYVNGTRCGETGYKYPPRFYPIPEGVLREGENVIEIHMYVFRDHGGFMPGKKYGLRFDGNREIGIDLTGTWDYEVMREMETLPDATFFTYKASALYQGMLVPVRRCQVCAALFYQGESNVECRESYDEEMEALISDWRTLFGREELPFIFVQLAGFSDGELKEQGDDWAEFRAEQEKTLRIEHTAMVSAIDIGEYNDLHPMDKKTLGERLALAVRKLVYKESVTCSGPVLKEVTADENNVLHLTFSNAKNGLRTLQSAVCAEESQAVGELEIRDTDGTYRAAEGKIEGEEVLIPAPAGVRVTGVRYAWRNCPAEVNLYNKEGLPAVPFCREWE